MKTKWRLWTAAVAVVVSACGDTSDNEETSGGMCVRAPDEDAQCATMADTTAFYLCESDRQRAPLETCVPLGDTGDYCCPENDDSNMNGDWWRPAAGVSWDWQLSDPLDSTRDVDVYDVDWETSQADIDALIDRGVKVICYISVGTFESWRPDADDYPEAVIGPLWPEWDEHFVDIRSDAVRDIVENRMDICAAKGFHGVEPDNMDVFELEGDSGFPLTEAIGFEFARWLAGAAHARGLAVFQKNASSLTNGLVQVYDGALTEDCFVDDWCDEVAAYAEADKPVFMAEYTDTGVDFDTACAFADANGFSAILKDRDLTASFEACGE